jgi:tRNA-Thr(GGU) m(6)t(6)A37 methyltransferase TsaA
MKKFAIFKPIGTFKKGTIHIHKKWAKGLKGIEDFSHLIVLFWLHQAEPTKLLIHPQRVESLPKVGVFATRSPSRPNPIGLTVVKLLKRRGRTLWIEGFDAWDKTPILDIKPYTKGDAIKSYNFPEWLKFLYRNKKKAGDN